MKRIQIVTLELDIPIYLTNMHRDYDYDGETYIAGQLLINQATNQKAEPSTNDFTFTLSAVDGTMISAFTSAPYKGKRCLVREIELNDDQTPKSIKTIFDGDLNKYLFNNGNKSSTLKITSGSIFSSFDAVKMLNLGVQFADTINDDQTIYWGKNAPTTTPYSGGRPKYIEP